MNGRLHELNEKAFRGEISATELDDVAATLRTSSDPEIQVTCLNILGRGFAFDEEELIASYLVHRADVSVPEAALWALVKCLGRGRKYVDTHVSFIRGIDEDEDAQLKLAALQLADETYRATGSIPLLREIWNYTYDGRESFRESARVALVRALQPNFDELSPKQRNELLTRENFMNAEKSADKIIAGSKIL